MEVVTSIAVTKYDSELDRVKEVNGTSMGTATSYEEFQDLVGKSGRAYLAFTDAHGTSLYYGQVKRAFGKASLRGPTLLQEDM